MSIQEVSAPEETAIRRIRKKLPPKEAAQKRIKYLRERMRDNAEVLNEPWLTDQQRESYEQLQKQYVTDLRAAQKELQELSSAGGETAARKSDKRPYEARRQSVYGPIGTGNARTDKSKTKVLNDKGTGHILIEFVGDSNPGRMARTYEGEAKRLAEWLNDQWEKDWQKAIKTAYKIYTGDFTRWPSGISIHGSADEEAAGSLGREANDAARTLLKLLGAATKKERSFLQKFFNAMAKGWVEEDDVANFAGILARNLQTRTLRPGRRGVPFQDTREASTDGEETAAGVPEYKLVAEDRYEDNFYIYVKKKPNRMESIPDGRPPFKYLVGNVNQGPYGWSASGVGYTLHDEDGRTLQVDDKRTKEEAVDEFFRRAKTAKFVGRASADQEAAARSPRRGPTINWKKAFTSAGYLDKWLRDNKGWAISMQNKQGSDYGLLYQDPREPILVEAYYKSDIRAWEPDQVTVREILGVINRYESWSLTRLSDHNIRPWPGDEASTEEEADAKSTSATILKQLGGGKFLAMTGAKNLTYGTDKGGEYLSMQLPTRGRKPNSVKITHDAGRDLYNVEFAKFNMRRLSVKPLKKVNGLDVQGMREAFKSETGLELSL